MRAWMAYAATSATLVAGLSVVVGLAVGAERAGGVWVAGAVAMAVQLAAFGALVRSRRRGRDFLVSWASGMVLRFAVIAGLAFWVTRRTGLDPAVTLLSLVGFVFLLVVLEPAFLRLAETPAGKGGRGRTIEDRGDAGNDSSAG
ncbi:MAG TPA: hypothetical protein VMM12_06080 [Longimicrobiales bacterium]|nr:hypothetical protein [Longimicrobiales bacterium]